MSHLEKVLVGLVKAWRSEGYPVEGYPSIAEILEWSRDSETGALRFLRSPQLRALETYWYLRLVQRTPHVFDLYTKLLDPTRDLAGLLEALGVPDPAFKACNFSADTLWARIRSDDEFVRDFSLEALRETLTLAYPSYILALATGAGKTVLIGAIVATEFAMAMEYPDGPFVRNALVFAPGTTILESLRELAETPYDKILPPRFHKRFAASVKLTFTRDGARDIPVVRSSLYNVVVTNTEKIRIQKEAIRKGDLGTLLAIGREDEARVEVANLRLQAIASLPDLAVFSDEAHHTYGQSLDLGLKKVRKTVDYLASRTSLVCVVNTTGTPYFQRQPLKDVVIWYGLSERIRKWRRYTPDFIIRKKVTEGAEPGSGRVCIVEVKAERERAHPNDGERGRKAMALREWEDLYPDRLKYEMDARRGRDGRPDPRRPEVAGVTRSGKLVSGAYEPTDLDRPGANRGVLPPLEDRRALTLRLRPPR